MHGRKHFYTSSAGVRWDIAHGDKKGERLFIGSQDVDPILDANMAMRNHNDGYSPSRELRRVGSIPVHLIHKWKLEEGWDAFDPDHAEKLRQKLNDLDFIKLRTADGRLGKIDGGGGFR